MAIAQATAIEQGKGGVGKTTCVVNIAGLAARAGFRTLVVDLDPQGNTARDLGYPLGDGEPLFNAIRTGGPLPIMKNIRENLDVVPGGPALGDISGLSFGWHSRGDGDFGDRLEAALREVEADYDLILIDTPPGDRVIAEGALIAATSVIIPTRPDDASIDGVVRVAERFQAVSTRNPSLRLAGVVIFATNSRGQRVERKVREKLGDMLGGAAPVFESRIRYLESASVDARQNGLLVHELEDAVEQARGERLAAIREGRKPSSELFSSSGRRRNDDDKPATGVEGLAEDYQNLTQEILTVVGQIQRELLEA
jgi:chromosome partitioning protein